jgi:ABC-type multidrug transport system permease subunit
VSSDAITPCIASQRVFIIIIIIIYRFSPETFGYTLLLSLSLHLIRRLVMTAVDTVLLNNL